MSCSKLWTTREGLEISLHDMETQHIINALPFAREIAGSHPPIMEARGEAAQYYAEQAEEQAWAACDKAADWVMRFEEELSQRQHTTKEVTSA